MIDIKKIRNDFPILKNRVYGKPLVYLDNAATTHKPQVVIDSVVKFYSQINSNIHRGAHYLSELASGSYENSRETVRKFINANTSSEVIFTAGTTAAINMIANSFGCANVRDGDEIIISGMEHHSNIVPWQLLCERVGAKLNVIPINSEFGISGSDLQKLINSKTRLVSLAYVSNVLGTINPIKELVSISHRSGVPVLVDAAQAVQHFSIDVQDLDCDFLVFSGHKMYAETGIGVLYGKESWLEKLPPSQGGGGMVKNVSFEKTTYADLPLKFEAGTPNFVGAESMRTAIRYISDHGLDSIRIHEKELIDYAQDILKNINGLKIYGSENPKCGAISFNLEGINSFDVGMILDKLGIAIRTGNHCAEPIMKHFGIDGTVRASFAIYNIKDEVDRLVEGIEKVRGMLV